MSCGTIATPKCTGTRATLVVGARFEDTLRAGMAKGNYVNKGREEEWLAERLAGHRRPENSFELQLPGDRWVRVDERRTADGGSIGVRIDITEFEAARGIAAAAVRRQSAADVGLRQGNLAVSRRQRRRDRPLRL